MFRLLLTVTLIMPALLLGGCTTSEYSPSNQHCSSWYIAKEPVNDQTYELQKKCLEGYYSPVPMPTPAK